MNKIKDNIMYNFKDNFNDNIKENIKSNIKPMNVQHQNTSNQLVCDPIVISLIFYCCVSL